LLLLSLFFFLFFFKFFWVPLLLFPVLSL